MDFPAEIQVDPLSSVNDGFEVIANPSKTSVSKDEISQNSDVTSPDNVTLQSKSSVSLSVNDTEFACVKQVFHRVSAIINKDLLDILSNDIEMLLQKLSDEIGIHVVTEKTEDKEKYELHGSWDQIVSSYDNLTKQLPSVSQSNLANSNEHTLSEVLQHDKAVTCDIIKSEAFSSFALEHPRKARFSSLIFQHLHSPIRRIKEKYRTKRRCGRPRKLITSVLSKVPNSFSEQIDSENSSSQYLNEKRSVNSLPSVKDENDPSDQTDTENVEPFSEYKNHSEHGKPKPKKNYEELTPFKFFCKMCSFKTKRESHYQKHLAIHEKVSTIYKCDQCIFTSIRLSHLRRHEMTHSQITYPCSQCPYKTDDMKLLIRHMKMKHERDEDLRPKDLLRCPECPYQTTKQYHYQRHLRVHNGLMKGVSQLFQCDQCSYKTSRKEHFIRHVNNVHSNKRPYLCDFCGKAFKRTDALKQHRVTHAAIDPQEVQFKCPMCDKSCRSHAHLMEHQAVHSNVRSFLCEICGASFKTRSVQRKHVLTIHKNPRAYLCEHCDKRFNTNYALRRHLRLHEPGGELGRPCSPPLHPSNPPSPPVASLTSANGVSNNESVSHQSVILFPTSATAVSSSRIQGGTTELPNTTTIPFTIHPAVGGGQATIQLAASVIPSSESLTHSTDGATLVPIQEPVETSNSDGNRQAPQAYIQTNEATTALLYLTTNFAPF